MKNVHSAHYIAALLFFGYMAVVSFLFFVLTGLLKLHYDASLRAFDYFCLQVFVVL
jgi:hypothetical protein